MSLTRFFRLAQALNVAPSYFYEELFTGSTPTMISGELRDSAGEEEEPPLIPLERRPETLALTSAFSSIKEATIRKQIYNLCEAIADTRFFGRPVQYFIGLGFAAEAPSAVTPPDTTE